jgi:predicted alpha-1,2-mannosidase
MGIFINLSNSMRKFVSNLRIRCASVIILILLLSGCDSKNETNSGLSYVDPKIGNVALLLQPTRTTAQIPYQMIRMNPGRRDYIDDQIRNFPAGVLSIMPFTGTLTTGSPISAWDEQLEKSTPYYYSTWLEDYNITVEFAPGIKTGYYRFTFPDKTVKNIYLGNIRGGIMQLTKPTTLVAEFSSRDGMKSFFYGELNEKTALNDTTSSKTPGRFLTWPESAGNIIDFRYAVSYISMEQAQKNLSKEIPDWSFDKVIATAKLSWEKVMNQIQVKGGTEAQKRTFYTALYRTSSRMVNYTEDGQYYSGYDKQVHKDDRDFYVDDGIWDTYIALHPLHAILIPDKEADMVQSYVRMYEQSGWLPRFPSISGDRAVMNSFHTAIIILDAYRKGIRNFDAEKAYQGMKKNALERTMLPWKNGPACKLDSVYYEKGFYPSLRPGEKETVPQVHPFEKRQTVAVTLGICYDDWALAQMAKELGKTDDYNFFLKRSKNFNNIWWPEKGFFIPKDAKGEWIDIDPKWDGGQGGRDYYDENNGWTYLWQVQHDLPGLINLMGGKQNFENRLDQLFRESLGRSKYELYAKFPDFTGIVGQFSMGNEPSFHIPYLYNLTGSPWKTQKRIRMLLDTWYPDNIFGIPGDEDGGGMSAFVVFSSMGFFPLVPGLPIYSIGSPVFEEVTINLSNGKKFTILAPGGTEINKFIQKAWLNGQPLDIPWFTHDVLMKGGVLKLEMGPYPNKNWGNGAAKDSIFK